jgi:hypothetical protein
MSFVSLTTHYRSMMTNNFVVAFWVHHRSIVYVIDSSIVVGDPMNSCSIRFSLFSTGDDDNSNDDDDDDDDDDDNEHFH